MLMKKLALLTLSILPLVASCRGPGAPDPVKSAQAQKAEQTQLQFAQAFCGLIAQSDSIQKAAGQPIPDSADCAYFKQNGTMTGYSPPQRNQYTGFAANLRDINSYSKAQKAKLPANVAAAGAEGADIYRRLLVRGYSEQTAAAASRSAEFSRTVAVFKQARGASK
jgi:hypothetical protein